MTPVDIYLAIGVISAIFILWITHSKEWDEMGEEYSKTSQWKKLTLSIALVFVWPFFWVAFFFLKDKV